MAGIYKITNKINNKIYIGQTQKKIKNRWKEHIRIANRYAKTHIDNKYTFAIHKAMAKYGIDNFIFEILYEQDNLSLDKLNELEMKFIKEYNTFKYGYNLTQGGDGTKGTPISEKQKEYYRQLYTGRKLSEEHKKNIAQGLLNRNYKTSDKTKKIISDKQTSPLMLYRVDTCEIIRIFENNQVASQYLGLPEKKIKDNQHADIKSIKQMLCILNGHYVAISPVLNFEHMYERIYHFKINYSLRNATKIPVINK